MFPHPALLPLLTSPLPPACTLELCPAGSQKVQLLAPQVGPGPGQGTLLPKSGEQRSSPTPGCWSRHPRPQGPLHRPRHRTEGPGTVWACQSRGWGVRSQAGRLGCAEEGGGASALGEGTLGGGFSGPTLSHRPVCWCLLPGEPTRGGPGRPSQAPCPADPGRPLLARGPHCGGLPS